MASEGEYKAAIARAKNSPTTATKADWELVERAAKQAGSLGNQARAALEGK